MLHIAITHSEAYGLILGRKIVFTITHKTNHSVKTTVEVMFQSYVTVSVKNNKHNYNSTEIYKSYK